MKHLVCIGLCAGTESSLFFWVFQLFSIMRTGEFFLSFSLLVFFSHCKKTITTFPLLFSEFSPDLVHLLEVLKEVEMKVEAMEGLYIFTLQWSLSFEACCQFFE